MKNNTQPFWLHVFFSSLLAVLFSFFFVFAQATDSTNAYTHHYFADDVCVDASSDDAAVIGNHDQDFHFPCHSVPMAPEQESKDEKEKDSHSDEDTDKLLSSLSLNVPFHVASGKCLLLQLVHLHENRKEVSLIILHHSWKSYLA